jgi:tetratricopeptide (TPR) repeat protein
VMHALRLRDWVLSAVLAALAIGFPVAVILAWLYDFTSRGIERTPSATGPAGAALSRSRFVLPLTVAIAVLAIVAIGAGGWYAWKHAPARGVDASGRTTVAVADFANDTRDPDLDSLSGLLITSLEQSKKLHVLTRSRMLDHMRASGKGATDRIDEAVARDVGRRADVHALLLASVRKLGDTYVVEMRALDPEKDEYLFTLQETATGKEGIIPLIDRLSDRARLALRESSGDLAAADVKIGQGVTSSLEAYRHYFLSQQAMEEHDFERSLAEAKRALEIDPNMALAHAWIAWLATIGVAGAEDPKAHIQAAVARAGDLPPKERRFVEALASGSAGGFASLAADFPQDKYFALFAGMFAQDPVAKKLYLDKALAIDPTFVWPVYFIASELPGMMLPLAQRAADLRPGVATLFNLGLALGREGRTAEALETARRAQALARPPRAEVDILVTAGLAAQGRLPEAAAELEAWQRPDVAAGNRRMALLQATRLATLRGRREEALRTFAELDRFPVPGPLKGQAWLYAGTGGDDVARRQALLALKTPPGTLAATFAEAGLPEQAKVLAEKLPEGSPERMMWSAVADWKAGRAADSADAFTIALDKGKRRDSHHAYLLGRMLADAGRCQEALVAFDRMPAEFPWPWDVYAQWSVRMPLALLEGARCQVKLGRPAEARARLDRLLEMWKDADPGLPAIGDAKALRAKVAGP